MSMELQEIEIFIEKDGRVRIEVRGVQGLACLEMTRALEAALGGQIETRQMTPEAGMDLPEEIRTRLEQRRG
jgi:hypothetical protein